MTNSISEAIADIKNGKMVIVVDSEDRENEGDVVMAAEKITPDAVNFMITHCKGLICVPLTHARLEKLNLVQMVRKNEEYHNTKFTISVDSMPTTTGISAYDRYETIRDLINEEKKTEHFRRPGHIF
ncbi:MAG TPA: 3,4-dihydroxy-2-butanone-4-phosphate synthase, partial [Spirochaetota bacterium]|nr:3,4-dihydroxy-2-butanone-4-phosphate synthase [Spirochaetota bacterium]